MNYNKKIMQTERPFNFAQLLLERLNERFNEANNALIDGNIYLYYRALKTIKNAISFKLYEKDKETGKENENEELKELDRLFTKLGSIIANNTQNKTENFYFTVEKQLDELEKKLIKIMYDEGLYYPKYDKQAWEDVASQEPT
jgi:hypothetical protein